MSFLDVFNAVDIKGICSTLKTVTDSDITRTLAKPTKSLQDFYHLISPAADAHLEAMAQKAHDVTIKRFGRTMKLFIPMYLSNECFNSCTYCGFSMELKYPRKTLTDDEILKEAKIIADKGFQHILLLTGEAPKTVGVEYISHAIRLIKPQFASIGIEIQPLKTDEYKLMMDAGCDTVTVYQETYHRETYAAHHLAGKKKRFDYRLETTDRVGEAGLYRLNIGALFGLYEWEYEAIALATHLDYLQKKYWKTKLAVSLPRIQPVLGGFQPTHPISDQVLVKMICAYRLVFPDCGITLSTRESATLRDQLIPLGITDMSAESKTDPGGYSGCNAEEQFEISDHRSLSDVCTVLTTNGYDPMLKDWQ